MLFNCNTRVKYIDLLFYSFIDYAYCLNYHLLFEIHYHNRQTSVNKLQNLSHYITSTYTRCVLYISKKILIELVNEFVTL